MDEHDRVIALPTAPAPAAPEPPNGRLWIGFAARLAGPLAGAIVAFTQTQTDGGPLEIAVLSFVALLAGALLAGSEPRWTALLPFTGTFARTLGPLLGAVLLLLLQAAALLPGLGDHGAVLAASTSFLVAVLVAPLARRLTPVRAARVAVIGSGRAAESLARELRLSGVAEYEIVGRVSFPGDSPEDEVGDVELLGQLDDLGRLVERHGVDLLLMTGEPPRMAVFEEIGRSCLHLPVRLRELSSFYEDAFGHVAVAEINAAWFQWIMHPRYRARGTALDRALDLTVIALVALPVLPLLGLFALIIRRDGGSVLFRQVRIGEGGRPFTIYKLRTMREGVDSEWAMASDSRVTGIGKFLRKTHLDELPQLFNVLKGDMAIVGPRPEQPAFVEQLEQVIPFYQRRHLMKPGLTGWAQVRCGYAGSEIGSAWKVCHDLYYLKHRSFGLNLVILFETVRTLVADAQYTAQPTSVDFILAPTRSELERAGIDAVPASGRRTS